MSCGIYKITNQINQKCYIGQSINIESRWVHHKNYNKKYSKYPLYLAFKKYGINNFSFEIIEECLPEELDEKEQFYIKYYNSYKNGYNQDEGGQGRVNSSVKLSQEDIDNIYNLLLNSNLSQGEIANQFQVGQDTISEINQGKTRIKVGYSFPLRKNKNDIKFCPCCGKEIKHNSLLCKSCSQKSRRKTERPSREELKYLIRNFPFTKIANQYNVTDSAIRKWCDSYSLPRKSTEIKNISDEDWLNI